MYNHEEIVTAKSWFLSTKPLDVSDIEQFHAQLIGIWKTLYGHHTIDSETVLILDTLSICLNRALALSKQNGNYLSYYDNGENLAILLEIFHYVCEHQLHGGGAYTNAVSGLLTKLLQLMNYICVNGVAPENKTILYDSLKAHLMSMQTSQKSFYVTAEAALKDLNGLAQNLHAHNSRLPTQCLEILWSEALANSAAKAFCTYHAQIYKPRKNPTTYIQSWTVLVEDKLSSEKLRMNVIDYLLPHLFKPIPNEFSKWARKLHFQSMSPAWQELMLAVLKKGQQISVANDPIMTGLISIEQLKVFLDSPNEKTRLDAFSLAANAISASKVCPDCALEIIQDHGLLNTILKESTTPESRSAFMSVFRKALLNMKDFITTNEVRLKKKGSIEDESALHKYKSAINAILSLVVGLLIPDSSYAQIVTSLVILKVFTEHEFDGYTRKKSQKNAAQVCVIFTPELINTLLRLCTNNFDDIRFLASLILTECPSESFNESFDFSRLQKTLALLQTFKGRQSDSIAQLVATVFSIQQKNCDEDTILLFLNIILRDMDTVLQLAPLQMHGHFTAWANIFQIADFSSQTKMSFKAAITSLLQSIKDTWIMVKPQMKFSEFSSEIPHPKCWRVIKESATLLKYILSYNFRNGWYFFDSSLVPSICQLLIDQLTTMTHRGAFASISAAFVTSCEICFKTDSLSNYPDTIILQNLDLLQSHKQLITRRSAGIPFVFCGVINAASKHDKAELERLLTLVFAKLYDIATLEFESSGNETHDIPQVHALNCIRQLFKDSSLEDGTREHTNQALRLSLQFLNHENWSVKNSSLMLFTALNEKLFGSHKLGDILPGVNASLFFSRYAGIADILLTMLTDSDRENVNNIVPVLAIVSRLTVNSEHDPILKPFIALLEKYYLCHRVWKVREMSARLMANMIHEDSYSSELSKVLGTDMGHLSKNAQHGLLLYGKEIIEHAQLSKMDITQYTELAAERFLMARRNSRDGDLIIQRSCLQIMTKAKISDKTLGTIKGSVKQILEEKLRPNGAMSLFLGTATAVILNHSNEVELFDISEKLIMSNSYEVHVATCNYYLEHTDQFRRLMNNAPDLLRKIMESDVDYVKGIYLELVLTTGITIEVKIDTSYTEKKRLQNNLLALRTQNEPKQILQSIVGVSDLSVDVKILRATIVKELMACQWSDDDKVLLLLHRFDYLSDDSYEVRTISCFTETSIDRSKERIINMIRELDSQAALRCIAKKIECEIWQNLKDFRNEFEDDKDFERENLFINEVKDTKALLGVLSPAFSPVSLIECVKAVGVVAATNVTTLQCYAFNVSLDTAIRKAQLVAEVFGENEEIQKTIVQLRFILEASGYPLLVS